MRSRGEGAYNLFCMVLSLTFLQIQQLEDLVKSSVAHSVVCAVAILSRVSIIQQRCGEGGKTIVNVFPLPVCPYAMMLALYPSRGRERRV
jgi:hypothetical protein